MKFLLILVVLTCSMGCGSVEGRKTFLGVSRYDKNQCIHDAWLLKKKRIIYQRCFK